MAKSNAQLQAEFRKRREENIKAQAAEMAALRAENAALKALLAQHGVALPVSAPEPSSQVEQPAPVASGPSLSISDDEVAGILAEKLPGHPVPLYARVSVSDWKESHRTLAAADLRKAQARGLHVGLDVLAFGSIANAAWAKAQAKARA